MADLEQHAAELEAYATRMERAVSPEVTTICMEAVGQQARLDIYHRTVDEGLDADGAPFPGYSTRRTEIMPSSPYYSMLSGMGRTYRDRKGAGRAAAMGFEGKIKRRRAAGDSSGKLKGVVFDAGWAQIKESIGAHGGRRDMMMRGDMMGQATNPGFVIVAKTGETVTLDYLDALQRVKAAGQHERFNWWGWGMIQEERERGQAAFMDAWLPFVRGEG